MLRPALAWLACALTAALLAGCARPSPKDTFVARVSGFSDQAHLPWMLQHMAEIYPTRTISRGGPVHALPAARTPLAVRDIRFRVLRRGARIPASQGSTTFDEAFVHGRVTGLVVLHDGHLAYESYGLDTDAATHFTSWSVAKAFTSTLVGLAVGDRFIHSLDDSIELYVPEAKGTAYEGVTIRQALQMSSGVLYHERYVFGSYGSDFEYFLTGTMLTNRERANFLALRYPRMHAPGTVFNFNTAETQVLGEVVRNATGVSPSAYLEEKLWRPLGMEHDATWVLDRPDGMEMTGCCLNMTLRDEARFGQLFLQDGMWEGKRLLPKGWVAEATVPEAGAARLHFSARKDGLPTLRGYGYLWWWLGDGVYCALGAYGQFIWVDPKHRVVIARASAWPPEWNGDPAEWNWYLATEALASFKAIAHELAP